ncbi:sigma-70 family RNA polymerase sigma factor [Marinobacter halodurans]|uniref:Sigma-70 family RNA polymerase sigma factor n=1 Tax=Marinobacter halodurans TaxID=2528979 RepID=A0ABY1ZPK7_9GAMM|nr:sigma-70 family RNA polymerase sigma factor [Marinobacter halodurans]TBW58760.1 sigma-70 family RNA polymerase sigma factor [Marinobacter halodurans]
MGPDRAAIDLWQAEVDTLITRIARHRDVSALEALYRLTSARLMGLTLRMLNNQADCADLLQELYLKVWQQAHQFGGRGSAWGWLCVMARNAALDQLRSRQHRGQELTRDIQPLMETLPAPCNDAAVSPGLERCLQALREEQRELILLSYIHGYSHQELQDLTARPLGTIKSWVRRGLQELKQCLER